MRKIRAFLFFISLSLVSSVQAKVCFLPGVFGGDTSCLSDAQYANCEGFDQTTPCPKGQEQVSCVKGGKTYYRCYCRADTYRLEDHPEYRCQEGYTTECGCAARHLECSPEYMYEGDGLGHCKNYPNTDGVDACILPNGRTYYKDCKCGSKYQYFCHETGLREPIDERYMCEDPSGVKSYVGCECDIANGWSSNGCRDRWDGCTEPMTYIDMVDVNGNNLRCAQCEEYVCPTIDEFNVLAYFCTKSTEINFDCEDLGYTYAPSGACPADSGNPGEVGVRCPFNRDYMNCQKPENCYPNLFTCEEANPGAVCELIEGSEAGCYGVVSCDEVNGYRKNGTRCEPVGCPVGYRAGLTTCTKEGETYERNGMSGGEICGKCVCSPSSDCVYTANPNDHSSLTINNDLYQPIFAGSAELTNQCCNGYYSSCAGRCTGRDLATDADPNMELYDICTACGEKYYIIRTCQSGYEVKDNACEASACDTTNGYVTTIRGTADCLTAQNMYQGAYGWAVESQKDSNGNVVQSGTETCNRCVCSQPSTPGSDDLCRWNNENKGADGVLKEEDLCCNGYYKDCFSAAPEGSTAAACDDERAKTVEEYYACDFGKVCFITECNEGYRVQNNRCVTIDCRAPYTTSNQQVSDCGSNIGWDLEYDQYENGNYARSGQFYCTQCVCTAPETPSESDECRWNKDNKGSGDLTDLCCNGYYATCATRCVGLTQDAVTEPAGKFDVAVNDAIECTGCGETLYRARSCKTENGYDRVGDKCVHTGCAEGYDTQTTSESCPSGYEYVIDPARTDEGTPCGKCEVKGCEAGYALEGDLDSCANNVASSIYWKLSSEQGTPSGENACYKCEAKSCENDFDVSGKTQFDPVTQYPVFTFDYYNPSTNSLEPCYVVGDRTPDEQCAAKYESEDYKAYVPGVRCVGGVVTITEDGECYYCASCASKTNEAYYPTKQLCELNGYYRCGEDELTGCYVIRGCGSAYFENNCSLKTPNGSAGWGWTEINPLAGITPAYILPRCGTCSALTCEDGYATNVTCNQGEWLDCSTSHYAGDEDCCRCPCDAQHRTELEECGDTGSAGWYFRADDTNRCKLCVAKECADVNSEYQSDPCTSGYNQTEHTVTLGDNTNATCYKCVEKTGCPSGEAPSAAECGNGNGGESGWTIGSVPTGNMVGDRECYLCSPKSCAPGDATVVANCGNGTGGANGWYLGTAVASYNGDTPCYTCLANPSCPPNEVLNGGTCAVGYEQGEPTTHFVGDAQCYECKDKACTTGATDVSHCGNGTIGALGWILGDNTGEMSGATPCKQCIAKQCSDHNAAYYPVGGCPSGFRPSITHNNLYLGDTPTTCVECQQSSCNDGYATVADGCGTGRIIDMNQPGNQSGGDTCYKCICDTSNGYYETCPNGANCPSQVNNCYVPTGCHAGFIKSDSSELAYFEHTTMYKFNVGSTEIDCHTISGCKASIAVPLADVNQTMFDTTCHTVASTTCCEINGCQSGYTLNTPCTGETTATETDTLLGKTCRKCEGCVDIFGEGAKTSKEDDENCQEQDYGTFTCYYNCGQISCATQGYYEPADTKCDRSLKNVTTALGTTCKTGDGCYKDMIHGYYYKTTELQNYFTYNGPNVCGKATNDTLDCYEITGCNRDVDSTCWSNGETANTACKQEIATKYGVPVSALTFTKKTQGITYCNVLTGCAQTSQGAGWTCSSKTVNGQTCYYNCTANACTDGATSTEGCPTGYEVDTNQVTGQSGDETCYKCVNCAMKHSNGVTSETEPTPASDYSYEHEMINGKHCYYNIESLSCSAVGAFDECPTGFSCTPYNEDCVSVTGCDTTNGYNTTACNSTTQVELFNDTKGGQHCYKCRNKTCAERYTDGTTTQPSAGYNYSQATVDGQACYYNISAKTCVNGTSATSTNGCPSDEIADTSSILSYAGELPCYECKSCTEMGGELTDRGEGWSCVGQAFHNITCFFGCEDLVYCTAPYAISDAACGTGYKINTSITNGEHQGADTCYLCEDCAARHTGKLTWTSQPDTNIYEVEGDEDVNGVHCWWGRAKTCVERGYYSSCPPDRICISFILQGTGQCRDGNRCDISRGYVEAEDMDTPFTYTESEYNHTAANDTLECFKVTGCDSNANSFATVAALASHFGVPQSAITYTTKTQGGQKCYVLTGCAATSAPTGQTCQTKVVNGETCYYNCVESECQPGSATSTDDCPVAQIIDTNSPTNMSGEEQCYECVDCKGMGGETDNPGEGYTCVIDENFHGISCYFDCEENGCESGSATSSSDCGTGRILGSTQTGYAGGDPCYECVCNENAGYYNTCPTGAACTNTNGCAKATDCASGWYAYNTSGLEYFAGYYDSNSQSTFKTSATTTKTCVNPGQCYSALATGTAPNSTTKTYFNYSSKAFNGVTCYYPTSCKKSGYEDLGGQTCIQRYGNYYYESDSRTWVNMTCTKCNGKDCEDIGGDNYDVGDCPEAFLCEEGSVSWCERPYACNSYAGYSQSPCTSTQTQIDHQGTWEGLECYKCQDKSCSDIYPGGTTEEPGQYCTYSGPETVNGEDCYWDVEPTTCDEELYPYYPGYPANSTPTGTPCIIGNEYCEEDERRYPSFSCNNGYYYKEEDDECVEKDCEYYNLYSTCGAEHQCETCPTTTRNTGLRTITCYTGQVSQDNCKTTCEEYIAQNGDPFYSSSQAGMNCTPETVTNDLSVDMTCWECSVEPCTPSCPSNMMSDDDYHQDYACQTSVEHTVSDGCGGTITCYTISDEACKTSCEDYGYEESIADGYSCSETTVTNDFGEEITCYKCTPCDTECGIYKGSPTGTYTIPIQFTSQHCQLTCYCSLDCEEHGFKSSFTTGYTAQVVIWCGNQSATCYSMPTCQALGLSSTPTSYYNTSITIPGGITCYYHPYDSGGGGGGGSETRDCIDGWIDGTHICM